VNDAVRQPAATRGYPDLRDHLKALEEAGLLLRVDIPINKDTELHPLVRWQFRGGIAAENRKAFLFTDVTDAKGKKYAMPVVVGAMAASPRIYSIGMGCPLEKLTEKWVEALNHPVLPVEVNEAACHEVIVEGDALNAPGRALDALPVPISTPGWDNGPYLTNANFITRDPETGVQNIGNYRGQIKAPRRLGMNTSIELRTGGYIHWEKWKKLGKPMPCAVVVGGPPAVAYTAVQKVPESVDEVSVAGGLVGAPIRVVRCRTVDIMVPAESEIVIEGFVSTDYLEPEAPFGESHGYVNLQEYNGYMDVTCITHRRDAIYSSFISQVSPSESSGIRRPAHTTVFLQHLRDHLGIKGVLKVSLHEPLTNIRKVCIIQMERGVPTTEVWRALYGAASLQRASGKMVIAVNDDIDPDNADALLWAIAFRRASALSGSISTQTTPMPCCGPSPSARSRISTCRLSDTRTAGTGRATIRATRRIPRCWWMPRSRPTFLPCRCPNASTWSGRERSGNASSACRSCAPRARGTAIPSAPGARNWNSRPSAR